MTAALRLVDLAMSMAPTMMPSPLGTYRPGHASSVRPAAPSTMRPTTSMHPTMVPGSRSTFAPSARSTACHTDAPSTKRSATVFPRFDGATRQDAKKLLATLRSNVAFLEAAVSTTALPVALEALADIHSDIDRLESRLAVAPPTPSLLVRHA